MLTIYNVPDAQISLKWREQYVSEGINRKGVAEDFGILRGMEPYATGVAGQVAFYYDAQSFDSVARIRAAGAAGRKYSLTYSTDAIFTVSLPATIGKYYLAIRGVFTIAGTTTVDIVSYTDAEMASGQYILDGAAIICMVDYQAVGVIDSKWIVFCGNTANGTFWSRSFPETSGSSRGDSSKSLLFQDDFAFPARWTISGTPLSYVADLEEYKYGASSLKVSNSTGLSQSITLTQNNYLMTWSRNKASGHQNRIMVDLWYRTDAGFVATGDCGIDLLIGYHDGTNMHSVYASALIADLVSFNWITTASLVWKKLQWEIPEAALTSLGTIRWVKPYIKANISNGTIYLNRFRVFQLTPPEAYGAEDAHRVSIQEIATSVLRLIATNPSLNYEQGGDAIKSYGLTGSTTLNVFTEEFPANKRNQYIKGNNASGTQNQWRYLGDPLRVRGRSSKSLENVDLSIVDGRQELDSTSILRSSNPLNVPGGYLACYSGNLDRTIITRQDGIVSIVNDGNGIRINLEVDPISGLSLSEERYIVTFSYHWSHPSFLVIPYVGKGAGHVSVVFSDGSAWLTPAGPTGASIFFDLMVQRSDYVPLFT